MVMKQIGVDLCSLPEVDGFRHLVVCIDYFSKWSEAKPIMNKKATTIAQFLYELMCRHGCFSIQINDQGREFVNEITNELHRLTGVEQRITSAYHPQANGLVERQNRTIKNSLIKVLDENATQWPYIIEGVLFAHRVSKHASTKYSPFKLLYNRDPVLPIDIKHNLPNAENRDPDDPFDMEMFDSVLASAITIREEIHEEASENIEKAQKKQKTNYDNRHQSSSTDICVGDEVLLRNNKRNDRKGGKFCFKWLGPYIVSDMTKAGLATLQNKNGYCLKKKYNKMLLKPFNTDCNFFCGAEQAEVGDGDDVSDKPDCEIDEEMPSKHIKTKHDAADEKPTENHNQWERYVSNYYKATFPQVFLYLFHFLE